MQELDKIGYTRVSTKDQEPENQIRLLIECGIPEDYVFVDKGISGTVPAENRPGFKKAMLFMKEHPEIKYLYVFELSRLGRNFVETAKLIEDLGKTDVMVWSISPTESFMRIPDKSIRNLITMLMLWVAERERENLIERTKAGIDRARAEGKQIGKPRVKMDWDKIRRMRAEGKSWKEIEEDIGCGTMTLWRARKRRGEM